MSPLFSSTPGRTDSLFLETWRLRAARLAGLRRAGPTPRRSVPHPAIRAPLRLWGTLRGCRLIVAWLGCLSRHTAGRRLRCCRLGGLAETSRSYRGLGERPTRSRCGSSSAVGQTWTSQPQVKMGGSRRFRQKPSADTSGSEGQRRPVSSAASGCSWESSLARDAAHGQGCLGA